MTALMFSRLIAVCALVLILIGILFALMMDGYVDKHRKRLFYMIIALVFTQVLQNCLARTFMSDEGLWFFRLINCIYGYSTRPLILALFCSIVDSGRKHKAVWILVIINAVAYMTALFSDICFTITRENVFHRGPFGYTVHIVSAILLVYLLVETIGKYRAFAGRDIFVLLFNVIMIIAATIADTILGETGSMISFLTVSMTVSVMLYYIWLHMQYIREHDEEIKTAHHIRLMISQIQPHFLHNTLTTIQALCEKDPAKAADLTGRLGVYLRQKMEHTDESGMISWDSEMEQTEIYLQIEKARFPYISVAWDIKDRDFDLPSLTIQPMVENAIRHGVRGQKDGSIKISTARNGYYHEIIIEDNGVGFDLKKYDGVKEKHIGIRNVRERIEKMCGGSLSIESGPQKGTRVIIMLPV